MADEPTAVRPPRSSNEQRSEKSGCCCRKTKTTTSPLDKYGMIADHTRGCTDILCLFVMFAAVIGMVTVSTIGIKYGNVHRLIYGTDYLGRTCGHSEGVEDRKLVVYPRFFASDDEHAEEMSLEDGSFFGVCVSRCPQFAFNFSSRATLQSKQIQESLVCTDNIPYRENKGNYRQTYQCFRNMTQSSSVTADGKSCYIGSEEFDQRVVLSNCWNLPWKHKEAFYRCIPITDSAGQTTTCVYPRDVTDPNDSRCQLIKKSGQTFEPIEQKQQRVVNYLLSMQSILGRLLNDALQFKEIILVSGVVFAGISSCILLILIQKFFGSIIWGTMIATLLASALLSLLLFFKSGLLDGSDVEGKLGDEVDVLLEEANSEVRHMIASAAIAMTLITAAIAGLIAYMMNTINKTVRIIKLSTKALRSMPASYFCPAINACFVTALAVYGVFTAASIYSLEDQGFQQMRDDVTDAHGRLGNVFGNSSSIPRFNRENSVHWMLGYHVFGLFWMGNFTSGFAFMTIAGAVGAWYFSLEEGKQESLSSQIVVTEEDLALDEVRTVSGSSSTTSASMKFRKYRPDGARHNGELWAAFKRSLRYHLGTVVFGSLCLTTLRILTVLALYGVRRFQKRSKSRAPVRLLCCCCYCLLYVMQKLVSLVTRQAYVFTAIKGNCFLLAAKKTMSLVFHNRKLVVTARATTAVTLFICKLMITVSATIITIVWIDSREDEGVSSAWFPALITALAAYGTASPFFRVLSTSVDTIIVSYLVDVGENEELNGVAAPLHLSAKDPNALNKARWRTLKAERSSNITVTDESVNSDRRLLQDDPPVEA